MKARVVRLGEAEQFLIMFILGMFVGGILSYMIAKPAAFRAKIEEIYRGLAGK